MPSPTSTPLARLIAVFYLLSGGWTLTAFAIAQLQGQMTDKLAHLQGQMTDKLAHLLTLPLMELALTLIAAVSELIGAIALLRRHSLALPGFVLALFANVLLALGRAVDVGIFAALGGAGIFATLFGWGLLAAVCVYTWRLRGSNDDQAWECQPHPAGANIDNKESPTVKQQPE